MRYFPYGESELKEILSVIKKDNLKDLFVSIPSDLQLNEELLLPEPLDERQLHQNFTAIGRKNRCLSDARSFLGAGVYHHYVPAVIDYLVSRGEFLTPYTPYQAEVSQGTLQAIYEYQSLIAAISQMDVVNSSLYDGSNAVAEAVLMAARITKKKTVLVSFWLHPEYFEVMQTLCRFQDIKIITIGSWVNGSVSTSELLEKITQHSDDLAAVVIQSPNFAGVVEDLSALGKIIKENSKALLIQAVTESLSLAFLKPSKDVDILAAEGQSFGLYPQAGGPHIGIFATRHQYLRAMPGRLVGKCHEISDSRNEHFYGNDQNNNHKTEKKNAYVLTLSTREQHIRREKATSNICTNQGIMAIRVAIYLSLYGKKGLFKLADINHKKARSLQTIIGNIPGWTAIHNQKPIFNEFIVQAPVSAKEFIKAAELEDFFPGLALEMFFQDRKNEMLITVTEMNSQEDMAALINFMRKFSSR